MRQTFWKVSLCAFGLCVSQMLVAAAPLDRADVAEHPAWLLHVDFDALRPTPMGQFVLSQMDQPEAQAKLAVFRTFFNFDLRTQLHGATLYGTTSVPEDAVLLVYADFDPDRLVLLAQAAQDHQTTRHNHHVIHSWLNDHKTTPPGEKKRVFAAIQDKRVIFGQREETVADALDVLDNKSHSLAVGLSFSDLGHARSGDFIEAGATKLQLPQENPNAAIMKLARSVELVIGQRTNHCEGKVTLVADNDEIAGHILAITQGIVALVRLQNNPQTARLAEHITIAQDGSQVVGSLELPLDDVIEMLKAGAARREAMKQDHP